ncbi:MAG TPA: hypothetical protein VM492_16920 [Sumerlaeia bacterium]|nr:hypothetical protein [Sumerlaeia bacterium]
MANFARASITNIHSGEKLEFQFNPVQWTEQVQASYSGDQVLFGTRDAVHWTGTRSMKVPLELIYILTGSNAMNSGGPGSISKIAYHENLVREDQSSLADVERFLKALMYPDPDLESYSPPDIIFEWPGVTRIFARVTDLEITYEQFDIENLAPLMLRAKLNLTEVNPDNITASGVRVFGSLRATDTQIPSSVQGAKNLASPTRRFMTESVPVDGSENG